MGVIQVSEDAPPAPASYPLLADPFSAGLQEAGSTPGSVEAEAVASEHQGHDHGTDSGVTNGDGSEGIPVTAVISGFDPSYIEAGEGEITLTVVNEDAMPHDFTIDELGVHVGLEAGETKTFTFAADPGTYEFYCSIPGHREVGMVGELTVLPA